MSIHTIKIKRLSILGIVELLLFMISFNLFGLGSKLLLVLLAFTFIDLLVFRECPNNEMFLLTTALCIMYFFSSFVIGIFSLTYLSTHIVCPLLMSYWGARLIEQNKNDNNIERLVTIIYLGFILMGLYSLLYMSSKGYSTRIEVVDLWGQNTHTAIQQTIYMAFPESLLIYYVTQEKGIKRGIGLLLFGLSVYSSLYFASRTGIMVIVITAITALLFFQHYTNKSKRLYIVIVALLVFLVASFLYNSNAFNIQNKFAESNLYMRLYVTKSGLDSNSRSKLWFVGLKELWKNPFGSSFKYAHNYWIDLALECGIFSGIFLIIYTYRALQKLRSFMKCISIPIKTKIFIISVYTGMIVSMFIEPMQQSLPLFVGNLFFVDAVIDKTVMMKNKDEE